MPRKKKHKKNASPAKPAASGAKSAKADLQTQVDAATQEAVEKAEAVETAAPLEASSSTATQEASAAGTIGNVDAADPRAAIAAQARSAKYQAANVSLDDAVPENVTVRTISVKKRFITGSTELWALKGITLDIIAGEYLSIMGPSGSGKSTLFNAIGVLDKPTEGHVLIDGVDTAKMDKYQLTWLRNQKIGYIFQTFNLVPVMTALENVTLPMILGGLEQKEADEKGGQILDRVGLGHRLHHRPGELSGGQQQRVAIARSLANDPAIILADEPTGNLDLKTGEQIIDLLRGLKSEYGCTIISATHDHKMLAASDRIVWIEDGQIDKIARAEDLQIKTGKFGEG